MEEKNIHMGLGVGGLTKPMCELLDRGLARKLVDTQDFDLDAEMCIRDSPFWMDKDSIFSFHKCRRVR